MAAASAALPALAKDQPPDYALDIAPYTLDLSPRHSIKTTAYNQQIPGPVLRFREGKPVTIDVTNHTADEEIVHWHGLFLPPDVDGSMEEGTPMIPPGGQARYTFTPTPTGFRWYHTHTFAGDDLKKGQYSGQHGFLLIEPASSSVPHYDQEFFLALHDWDGEMTGSADGSMNPAYRYSTINGRILGFADPLRVKQGQKILLHLLNSSPTEVHWIALSGHQFRVVALDGNTIAQPTPVPMLRLTPAERICAIVEMNNPGTWVLGEVRKHIQAAGMGIVIEYAGSTSKPAWQQPRQLLWNYADFAAKSSQSSSSNILDIPLVFESRFAGHGAPDHWMINGKSWPHTDTITLNRGQRYRLKFINRSSDDHPVHLHRHTFELRNLPANPELRGIMKDVMLVEAKTEVHVEFTADHPGSTLFHCHQQNHMDMGFMMLFHYA